MPKKDSPKKLTFTSARAVTTVIGKDGKAIEAESSKPKAQNSKIDLAEVTEESKKRSEHADRTRTDRSQD